MLEKLREARGVSRTGSSGLSKGAVLSLPERSFLKEP